jgi:hypothetical protein
MPWLELAADLPHTSSCAQFDAGISEVGVKLELLPWVEDNEEGQIDQSDFRAQQYACRQLCLGEACVLLCDHSFR